MRAKLTTVMGVLGVTALVLLAGCAAMNSPPAWIIGIWSDEFDTSTYTFTAGDVVFTTAGISISFTQVYTAASADMSDSATSTSYSITITTSDGATTTTSVYRFVKLTPTSLNYSISTNGVTISPIPLYLQ